MTRNAISQKVPAVALAMTLLAAPAAAVTVTEGSFSGGDFSNAFGAPTTIVNGYDTVTGSLSSGDYDFLAFTGLAAGAQTITLNLTSTSAGFYFANGAMRYSATPFTSNASGTSAGTFTIFNFGFFSQTTQQLVLSLGPTFSGALYLALNLGGGSAAYSLSAPGNAPVAPVPLPASALLLGGALAGIGALRRREKPPAA
jgi:hypothetical protein